MIQIKPDKLLPAKSCASRHGATRCAQWNGDKHAQIVGCDHISLSAGPAAAKDTMVVDMSKMTCGELTKLGFQDFSGITMWLSGYYNASIKNTTIDLYQFAQAAKTVKDYCAASPRETVMSGAERALGLNIPRRR
ncbi:HdeA/HdeB family chaperone [Tardiphaga sp. 768_D3_N2_1]|uniref:HdeA/HdeB family chaperone n=1 Tax=Tardiphaga sp. 768_D3_N2_1 TaxID=3240783 RepID=UPI003F88D1DD